MTDPQSFLNSDDPKGLRKQVYGGYIGLLVILFQTYRADIDRTDSVIKTVRDNTEAIEQRIDKVDTKLINVDRKLVTFSNDIGWLQNEVKELRQGSKEIKDLAKRVRELENRVNNKPRRSH